MALRESRAVRGLALLTPERIEELIRPGPQYAVSTLRKHVWVERMYKGWCKELEKTCFPLEVAIVAGFIKYCGKGLYCRSFYKSLCIISVLNYLIGLDIQYAIGSIVNVIIPSLKRLHNTATGVVSFPEDINNAMNRAVTDITRSKTFRRGDGGRQPAILADIERVIRYTPELLPTKSEEASLWLIAVSTGARAITCDHVLISDITGVSWNPTERRWFVYMRYRVTKGNWQWNQPVTIEGQLDLFHITDPVWWLNQHLIKTYGLHLKHYENWGSALKNKKVWRWSSDGMREIFKDRMIKCGFPEDHFCFHSLRSGFICSALIKSGIVNHNYI
jgi:hypothetical protein